MSPEERALDEVRAWARRYRDGRTGVLAALKPRLRDGERYAVKLTGTGVSRVPADDPVSGLDPEGRQLGLAYGTTQRLLVANGRRVAHEWEWAQLSQVQVLPSYVGVVLRTDGDTADAVHRVRVPADPFALAEWKTAARWLQLEGCFEASRGRLDAWLDRLPQRVLAR